MRSSKVQIGNALDQLTADVKDDALDLVKQARLRHEPHKTALMKQAVDTPHRARAQVAAWIISYNQRNGAGTAQTFLQQCLVAVGSAATLASIDAELAAIEAQAVVLVNHVRNDGWVWEQVAAAIETAITPVPQVFFNYSLLPMPVNYTTVWGEPH